MTIQQGKTVRKDPRRRSVLFQTGSGYGNAVLNFRDSAEDEFDLYARRFHLAGQTLAEKMLSSKGYNDLDACPVIFLYRHALELYLKSVVIIGAKIMKLSGETPQGYERILKTHKLTELLPAIRQVFEAVGWNWEIDVEDLSTFEAFEEIVEDLERIDWGSYTFRYPVDTQGQASVPRHFVVNVPNFCRRMDDLIDLLEATTTGLREFWTNEIEHLVGRES